ncbi:MAG: hypothetical protein H6621_01655 [Halobacteriovoraceae bacterium]|nr:hypothetical protein [Halobacteriovoraceae bacterium]
MKRAIFVLLILSNSLVSFAKSPWEYYFDAQHIFGELFADSKDYRDCLVSDRTRERNIYDEMRELYLEALTCAQANIRDLPSDAIGSQNETLSLKGDIWGILTTLYRDNEDFDNCSSVGFFNPDAYTKLLIDCAVQAEEIDK